MQLATRQAIVLFAAIMALRSSPDALMIESGLHSLGRLGSEDDTKIQDEGYRFPPQIVQ